MLTNTFYYLGDFRNSYLKTMKFSPISQKHFYQILLKKIKHFSERFNIITCPPEEVCALHPNALRLAGRQEGSSSF